MVKISDIFQKEEPDKKPDKKQIIKPEEQKEPTIKIPREEIREETPAQAKLSLESQKEPSEVMVEKLKKETQKTKEIYQSAIELIKEILEKGLRNEPFETKKIKDIVEVLIEQLSLSNPELVSFTLTWQASNYLYTHSLNVCILSILMGLGLHYDKVRLTELGVAAILHDIGMIKVTDISNKPGKLSEDEYARIKHHPIFGVEILNLTKDLSKTVIYVAGQHHEYVDGEGYPKGLQADQISDYAKIVTIVDAYEALTHPRAHRDRLLPYDAVKTILQDKGRFDSRLLKVLIEQIGIFPIGSWVQLSTNEIGVVYDRNKTSPLRPIIKIILDADGKKLKDEKFIDLMRYPTVYIRKAIDEKQLRL
jgi:HD-GYP domain-containing protein (c-di-GMP phosphodiesterase class II)